MNMIAQNLFLGDLHDTRDLSGPEGITAVMSVITPDERYFLGNGVDGKPPKRCFIEIDDGEPYPFHWLTKALEQLDLWLQDGETVLVHCAAGISRSPTTIIAHLMGFGMTWDAAEKVVRMARSIILPHPEMKRSVLKYYKCFPYGGSLGELNE